MTDVVSVLKDPRFAKNREHSGKKPWLPGFAKPLERNMLDLDEPDHGRLRAVVHKAFTPGMVEGLRQRIQGIADHLLDAAESTRSVDLVRDYALPLPLTVIAELLGIPDEDRNRFHRWSKVTIIKPDRGVWRVAVPAPRDVSQFSQGTVRPSGRGGRM